MSQTISIVRIFSVVFGALLAAACSSPNHVIDTPEYEGLKYWQKPYVVAGQRYDPLLDSRGFTENGLASWYGRDFHGRKTSNGEIYDMHAMTAAHKTLPLGIFVRVKNLANGREAVVRLNDRGPFVAGRIIDLSYAAAKKIDIVGPGTAPVRIEVLGIPQTAPGSRQVVYQALAPSRIGSYAVQVGAFSASDNARHFAGLLEPQFGPATVQSVEVDGKTFYRVHVGRYPSLDAAEQARLDIQRSGFPHSFVVAND